MADRAMINIRLWYCPWIILALGVAMPSESKARPSGDWPVFGYDSGSTRFSPLNQITPKNVARLKLAWSYNMRPADVPAPNRELLRSDNLTTKRLLQGVLAPGQTWTPPAVGGGQSAPSSGSEFTPIVVDRVMYFGSPFGRVVALDATSGKELWALSLPEGEQAASRGLAYWTGDKKHAPRLVVTLRSNKVLTVDPHTGKINSQYGKNGILDLRTPDVMGNFPRGFLGSNAMPTLYRNLMILGSRGQENPALGPRGDVRAFDIVTGRMVWRFNSIPEPGEPNFGSWEGNSWKDRAGVNLWNSLTVDEKRKIAYLGFGAPAYDRVGVDRHGTGLYGSSIVAVNVETGKYLWHFQAVHHDIWDMDMPGVPTLIDVKRGGRTIPAVAVITKSSLLFILDRVSGKPLYQVREEPAPASNVPGEKAWPTQPIPVKPAALARQSINLDLDISDITPEHHARCKDLVAKWELQSSVRYEPIGYNKATVTFPGIFGGMNWWGGAFDRRNGYYIVNTTNLGNIQMLRTGQTGKLELAVSPGFWFADFHDGLMPCQKGPWGELMAVDLSTGEIAWRRPLGVTDKLPVNKRDTGRPLMGGPIVTAGGVIFVAATDDERFRAFEAKTGKLLWETQLDAAGHSTPLTYLGKDNRQYVALIATGGSYLGSPSTSDALVAYSLP